MAFTAWHRSRARSAGILALALFTTACSVSSGVSVQESLALPPDRPADPVGNASIDVDSETMPAAPSTTGPIVAAPIFDPGDDSIDFGPCDEFLGPLQVAPTIGWECGFLDVSMDPFAAVGPEIQLAVTRLESRRSDGAALVLNPGGPGGAGLGFAWDIELSLSPAILRNFDIVSWDPRGVGASLPVIECRRGARWADDDLIEGCADATGELSGFMSTPYHLADLEALRSALGQERLNYVGYSYGTALGASYANSHPDRVGRFVLDGAVSPLFGTVDAPLPDGEPWYAVDGISLATDRFFELCNETSFCDLGPNSSETYDAIAAGVSDLGTDRFPGLDVIDDLLLNDVLEVAMFDAYSWGLIATALEDAAAGDASTLDALSEYYGVTALLFEEFVNDFATNEGLARLVIYCADFQGHDRFPSWCEGLPDNNTTIGGIGTVDVDVPILVIGTQYDPSTPVVHAGELAGALGDAVTIVWEGVGHTAFPLNSNCIDTAVDAFLIDGRVPRDGLRCEALDNGNDVDAAEYLFELGPEFVVGWLEDVLVGRGESFDNAVCLADELSVSTDQVIAHVILGVDSDESRRVLNESRSRC